MLTYACRWKCNYAIGLHAVLIVDEWRKVNFY